MPRAPACRCRRRRSSDGKVVLNIAERAVARLLIDNDAVTLHRALRRRQPSGDRADRRGARDLRARNRAGHGAAGRSRRARTTNRTTADGCDTRAPDGIGAAAARPPARRSSNAQCNCTTFAARVGPTNDTSRPSRNTSRPTCRSLPSYEYSKRNVRSNPSRPSSPRCRRKPDGVHRSGRAIARPRHCRHRARALRRVRRPHGPRSSTRRRGLRRSSQPIDFPST